MKSRRLLLLITEDWYFWSHRLSLARAARDSGWHVTVVTNVDRHGERILSEGFDLRPLQLRRGSLSPWSDARALARLHQIYRDVRPDIAHHVALKPVIYGSLAARMAGVRATVNTLAGLGYAFGSRDLRARAMRPLVRVALKIALRGTGARIILQNPDDCRLVRESNWVEQGKIALIRGSGVDTSLFRPSDEPAGTPIAVIVSRMLRDKGVCELVEAARILRDRAVPLRVVLVGPPDPVNPTSIPAAQLEQWETAGLIQWQGPRDDIPDVWRQSHIAVLPSYREGLPKALLEAAASGRPMVATDVPGCRDVVRPNQTGILVPARDPGRLADALQTLATDPEMRQRFGRAAREMVEHEFSEERVLKATLDLYRVAATGAQ